MGFYDDKVVPILQKTSKAMQETPHMQDILHGTVSDKRFKFQILQNYQYLLDYVKCWAIGLSKCTCYEEMKEWYPIVKRTFEKTVMMNREFWSKQIGVTPEEMDAVIQAEGKRSYTSFQLMCAEQGGLAENLMASHPCNALYMYFAEDLLPQCTLPKDNNWYIWLEYYVSDGYKEIVNTEARMIKSSATTRPKGSRPDCWKSWRRAATTKSSSSTTSIMTCRPGRCRRSFRKNLRR